MNKLVGLMIAICVLALSACATNDFSRATLHMPGTEIKKHSVYIYSFLDIREAELGPNLLAEFDKQFIEELQKAEITAVILRFKESEAGRYYALTNTGLQVPVNETISKNEHHEKASGAAYRLIVFPSKMTVSGGWKYYDIRWDLIDVKTGKVVWSAVSRGKHTNAWRPDENPVERAKTIVDGAIFEMRKSNLL